MQAVISQVQFMLKQEKAKEKPDEKKVELLEKYKDIK